MHYQLTLQNHVDGLTESTWNISPPSTVGRDPSCDVCIEHDSVSRKHCNFTTNFDGALNIKDSGSMNGTYVDDRKIDHTSLMPGQIIQIGALLLKIDFLEDAPTPQAAKPKAKGNVYATQPMETFKPVALPPEKPWWKRIFDF